ncbi:MAG TPA: tetratricopeptide repeat protein [Pyrinomonadaceae bacterium]|jgi:tetratricopeptide (TPR) repeat protein|nr:tetratricopeptide repeat protein [Pyrinomonadaceae bacterium]
MSRLQLSRKYILVPLALLTLLTVLPASTHAKAGRNMQAVKSRPRALPGVAGRGRALLYNQTRRVELPNRDGERVQVFKVMFLLRLYMIFQQMYLEHLPQTENWSQIADDYRALSATSKEFSKLAEDHIPTSHFFDENEFFYGEMAALSSEVDGALKSNKLPPQYSRMLFGKIVVMRGGPLGYPAQYRPLIEPWVNRFNAALSRLMKIVPAAFEGWKMEFNFDAGQVFEATERLPFKFPFEEFTDEDKDIAAVDYLYDAFVKDAGLPPAMESYYKGALPRAFHIARNEFLFKMDEIALLWLEMASWRVPASLVARVFVDLTFDCANKVRQEHRAAHYERLSRMHKVIYDYLIQGDQVLFYLKQLAENKKAGLRYNRPKYERQISYLQKITEEYLAERGRLVRYPKGWADATARLAESSRTGESDLLLTNQPGDPFTRSDLHAFVDAVIRRKPFREWARKYAQNKTTDVVEPCGQLYDLLKVSVQKAFTGVEPLSQKIDLSAESPPGAGAPPRGEQAGRAKSPGSQADARGSRPGVTLGVGPAPRAPAEERPPTAEELVGRAEADYGQRRYDRASAACLEVLKTDPDQPRANLLLGKVYYQTNEYEKAVPHMLKAVALGETLSFPVAHHRKVFAGKSDNGPDNDLNPGEIVITKDRLVLRFTSNTTRTGVRVSDESFSVPLDRVYELKHEPDKEGRLRLVVGVAQGAGAGKEKRRTYNLYPADARVVRESGKLMSLSDTEIRCAPCSPATRLLHDLLSGLRK